MLERFKRYGWAFGLGFTALTSFVGAYITNRFLGKMIAPPEKVAGLPEPGAGMARRPPSVPREGGASGDKGMDAEDGGAAASVVIPPPAPPPPIAPARRLTDYEDILVRNIFDSEHSLAFSGPVDEAASAEGSASGLGPLNVRLYGTVAASPMQFSWAILSEDDNNATQAVFRIGDSVYGRGRLKRVYRNKVVIVRPDGTEETVERYSGPPPSKPEPIQRPRASRSRNRKNDDLKLGETIRKVGENQYEIDQSEIQTAMNNLDKLATSARIVPHYDRDSGKIDGFKVYRIKPNSFYKKFGLRNGDVITKINGYEMNSTEKALQLYQQLSTQRSFSVEIVRGGRPLTLELNVR